jgi:hypothetical protein
MAGFDPHTFSAQDISDVIACLKAMGRDRPTSR